MATTYDIRINSGQAESSLDRLQNGLRETNNAFGGLKNALAGIAIGSFITNAIRTAAALDDISVATGIALQNIIGFNEAIVQFGGNAESAGTGVARFSSYLQSAVEGNKKAQDSFLAMGISLQDLGTLSEQDLLRKTITGLATMGTGAQQTAAKVDIFGKSFARVSIAEVNDNLDKFILKAKQSAEATSAAAGAEEKFGKSLVIIQQELIKALLPISELAASILTASESISEFIGVAIKIGLIVASFTILGKVVSILRIGFVALGEGMAALIGFFTVGRNTVSGFGLIMQNLKLLPFSGRLKVIANLLGEMLGWLFKNTSALAALGVAFYSVAGYIGEAYDKLRDWLGLSNSNADKDKENADRQKKTAEFLKKDAETRLAQMREVQDAMAKEKTLLDKSLQSYRSQNVEANKKFQLETANITKSEKAKMLAEERLAAESTYLKEMAKLQDLLNDKKASTSQSDQAMIPAIQAAMGNLTAEYNKQQAAVTGLVNARVKETQANQLKLFQTQSLIDAETKLRDLGLQSSTMLLPEINKQYQQIATNAKAAADAAIQSEEARRREPLSLEEVRAYYKAAFDGVIGLIDAQTELNAVTDQYNLKQFGIKERINLENELIKIQDDMAKSTMSEIEKKYYDIDAAAKASAKSAIDAEAARRGAPLNLEEQRRYYEEAAKGSDILKEKQRELYENSRSFNTGWKNALNEYVDDATNAAKQAEKLFTKMAQSMEDSIVSFAKTGKFEFKGFLNSILEDLLRSQVRQLIGQLFGGSGGGSGGSAILGAIGSVGKAFGGLFANGGTLGAGKWGIAGERGAELISGPATITPLGAGGGSTYVNYTIQAVDAMSFKQLVARDPSFIHAVAEQGRKSVPQTRR